MSPLPLANTSGLVAVLRPGCLQQSALGTGVLRDVWLDVEQTGQDQVLLTLELG